MTLLCRSLFPARRAVHRRGSQSPSVASWSIRFVGDVLHESTPGELVAGVAGPRRHDFNRSANVLAHKILVPESPPTKRRIPGRPRLSDARLDFRLWIAVPGRNTRVVDAEIEDCVDADGGVLLPPGATLISAAAIDRNIANVGDATAYRYLDYSRAADVHTDEVTWRQFGTRLQAIGARVQQAAGRGERVAILAPQGIDYVAGFYAAVKAGTIAVPLFAPELPGHAERLDTALRDSEPTVVLTTTAAKQAVESFLTNLPHRRRPHVVVIDQIPDTAGELFVPTELGMDDVSHLQYTSGSTRPPVGVEVTHRAGAGQPRADDPLDRPAGPKHPRRQLVTALPRHGFVDDRFGGIRRTFHADVADGVRPKATAAEFMRCPSAREKAVPPPRRTSPTSGPRSVACRRKATTSISATARPTVSYKHGRRTDRLVPRCCCGLLGGSA